MRHELADRVELFGFRDQSRRTGVRHPGNTAERLPRGVSIIVIAALSALSWAVLIALLMGIYSLI